MKIVAKPIKVLAVFFPDQEQKPIPYKFKIDEEGEFQTVIIEKLLHSHRTKIAGIEAIVYSCQSTINGIEKTYELKYFIQSCKWELYKI